MPVGITFWAPVYLTKKQQRQDTAEESQHALQKMPPCRVTDHVERHGKHQRQEPYKPPINDKQCSRSQSQQPQDLYLQDH